ncbi:hypothetical protein AEP_00698 [Curvibacter sp. AEP1-3]|uniref:hypothetical protein n=1 Tax=Curvibacter sp. AEP1-3 TaxID=1844971 RepID=UPI000B3CBFB2|nr:hypothetical protein [Curvibacter sp. AEP1-3]ARV17658.1 hypothetical protein AEP_00698 [Curvibacter sp. AEP1-3]
MTKRQLAFLLAAIALMLHTLCFDWAFTPSFYPMGSEDPRIFWQVDLSSFTGKEGALYLLFDWSYGVFPGINLVFVLAGLLLPAVLAMISGTYFWNDYQQFLSSRESGKLIDKEENS